MSLLPGRRPSRKKKRMFNDERGRLRSFKPKMTGKHGAKARAAWLLEKGHYDHKVFRNRLVDQATPYLRLNRSARIRDLAAVLKIPEMDARVVYAVFKHRETQMLERVNKILLGNRMMSPEELARRLHCSNEEAEYWSRRVYYE